MNGVIYYIWQNRLLRNRELHTTDGKRMEIIDYGSWDESRGIVKNAKLKIGDKIYNGDVLLHSKHSSCTERNEAASAETDNIILQISIDKISDTEERFAANSVQVKCNEELIEEYDAMERGNYRLPCTRVMSELENVILHSHLSRLLIERIEEKARNIEKVFKACDSKWDDTLFKIIIRSFGFGIQGNIFEDWAAILDMKALAKHRDNIVQIEAIMFGQAGLLNEESIPYYYREQALKSSYFKELVKEFRFLSHKFNLKTMDYKSWGTSNATPHMRIARLASLYYSQKTSMSSIAACDTIEELHKLLTTGLHGYWYNHTCFGGTETCGNAAMKARHCDIVIINAIVPILFIYGKRHKDNKLCNKAEDFLHLMKNEENSIVRRWKEQGIGIDCAADSQAFLQLNKKYCSVCNCRNCHFAYHYIKQRFSEQRSDN